MDDYDRMVLNEYKLFIAALIDAAGGIIAIKPEHFKRADTGTVEKWTDPVSKEKVYRRKLLDE